MKKIVLILLSILIGLNACEDPVPFDYEPKIFVEAYLLVGEPIKDIYIAQTQPLNESFDYDSSTISDLDVYVKEGNNRMKLEFNGYYYYPDSSYKVKENTLYELEIYSSDGKEIFGSTTTPSKFDWVDDVKDKIYYPKDTLELKPVDSIDISWEASSLFYFLEVKCLDTLEYGKYFLPATEEKNRRIVKPFRNDKRYRELTSIAFIPSNKTSIVWNIFKWFGKHELALYNPDPNFLEWVLQYSIKRAYDPLLGSIEGDGIGVFGSASVIRDTFLLVKNQP